MICRQVLRIFNRYICPLLILLASISCSEVAGLAPSGDSPKASDSSRSTLSFDAPPSLPALAKGETPPPSFSEVGQGLQEAGESWFFGSGIGRTAVNVGTVVAFPPYGLYLLGNAGLQLCGFQALYVTDALPTEVRQPVLTVYDGITSVPGRVNALMFNRDFHADKLSSVETSNAEVSSAALENSVKLNHEN